LRRLGASNGCYSEDVDLFWEEEKDIMMNGEKIIPWYRKDGP